MYKKVYLEITNNCNLNCRFCIKNSRPTKFMELNEFKIILDKLKEHTKYLYFHLLGEPILHPKINEFIEYCALKYEMLTQEQIRSHVLFKLNKTMENIKKLKKEDDGR